MTMVTLITVFCEYFLMGVAVLCTEVSGDEGRDSILQPGKVTYASFSKA